MVTRNADNMKQIILADRYNTHDAIEEEKDLWVINTLLLLGVAENDINDDNPELLRKYNIEVWSHLDNGDVEILHENVLMGKWYAPTLIAKYDEKQTLYYEIHLDYDSVFDSEIQSADE